MNRSFCSSSLVARRAAPGRSGPSSGTGTHARSIGEKSTWRPSAGRSPGWRHRLRARRHQPGPHPWSRSGSSMVKQPAAPVPWSPGVPVHALIHRPRHVQMVLSLPMAAGLCTWHERWWCRTPLGLAVHAVNNGRSASPGRGSALFLRTTVMPRPLSFLVKHPMHSSPARRQPSRVVGAAEQPGRTTADHGGVFALPWYPWNTQNTPCHRVVDVCFRRGRIPRAEVRRPMRYGGIDGGGHGFLFEFSPAAWENMTGLCRAYGSSCIGDGTVL